MRLLKRLPPEYRSGLRKLELAARSGDVGWPFVSCAGGVITLHSLPLEWAWPPSPLDDSLAAAGADIVSKGELVSISWSKRQGLSRWYAQHPLAWALCKHCEGCANVDAAALLALQENWADTLCGLI